MVIYYLLQEETDTCEEEEEEQVKQITEDPDYLIEDSSSQETEEEIVVKNPRKARKCSYRKRKFQNLSKSGKHSRVNRLLSQVTDCDEFQFINKRISKKSYKQKTKVTRMAALWLIKSASLSGNSYTDLRFWLENERKAGKDLSSLPTQKSLFAWAKRVLLPPGVTVVEELAMVPLQSILNTTCVR